MSIKLMGILLLLCAVMVAGCTTYTPSPTPTIEPTATPTIAPIVTPSPTPQLPISER